MNRRDFFKTTSMGIGALATIPLAGIASTFKPIVSHTDFEWMIYPSALAFRLERRADDKLGLTSMPVVAKSTLMKIQSSPNVDLTKDIDVLEVGKELPPFWRKRMSYNLTVHTNPLLLREAKEMGMTHLYMFVCSPRDGYNRYFVHGEKLPDWAMENGRLKIVNV